MIIDFVKFAESLSVAMDYAVKAYLDVNPNHGKRVAVLVNKMAKHLNFSDDIITAVTIAAWLHDIAVSEYLTDELPDTGLENAEKDMAPHCEVGEKILKKLPFYHKIEGALLYHHDRADGNGAMGVKTAETPIYAQLIHTADVVDVTFNLYSFNKDKYKQICNWLPENAGTLFSEECAEAFMQSIGYKTLEAIAGDKCKFLMSELIPVKEYDISTESLIEMCSIFSDMTDYKSHFTWKHSLGIANKAFDMGKYYGLPKEECEKLYIAGELHDIGKLLISDKILEKPEKLTSEEFSEVKNHAMGTWNMLCNISGMEEITKWAALHHEKLDGSGYPFGYTADKLDKNSRLMACLDIYQALVENRPYKPGLSHCDSMEILWKMANAGQIDASIVEDINSCFKDREDPNKYVNRANMQEYVKTTDKPAYKCPVCGYVHEGEMSDDFICPFCEQPGSIFEKVED